MFLNLRSVFLLLPRNLGGCRIGERGVLAWSRAEGWCKEERRGNAALEDRTGWNVYRERLGGGFSSCMLVQRRGLSCSTLEDPLSSLNVVVKRLVDTQRNGVVSSLTSEKLAVTFVELYTRLDMEDRSRFLLHIATVHCVDDQKAAEVAAKLSTSSSASSSRLQEEMRKCLDPPHNSAFKKVGQLNGGVKFLVNLRADLIQCLKTVTDETDRAALSLMNSGLQTLLGHWFSVGFLQLQRVSWDSPCSLLQRVSDLEAVHPVRDWTDLRARVGPYRRCYVYTHPSMPGEPVVILHVALTQEVASSISNLVKDHRAVRGAQGRDVWHGQDSLGEREDQGKVNAAIFYSVTSTQPGLAGIELGTHLIKGAVASLVREFPDLSTFSTLSPIPGFRAWLLVLLTKASRGEETALSKDDLEMVENKLELEPGQGYSRLVSALKSSSWVGDQLLEPVLSELLPRLCARYLYLEKRRNGALNPVANFHIRNGSCLWRINWMGDPSPRGISSSCGIMVNYRYYLERLEENSNKYLANHTIDVDSQVTDLLP